MSDKDLNWWGLHLLQCLILTQSTIMNEENHKWDIWKSFSTNLIGQSCFSRQFYQQLKNSEGVWRLSMSDKETLLICNHSTRHTLIRQHKLLRALTVLHSSFLASVVYLTPLGFANEYSKGDTYKIVMFFPRNLSLT